MAGYHQQLHFSDTKKRLPYTIITKQKKINFPSILSIFYFFRILSHFVRVNQMIGKIFFSLTYIFNFYTFSGDEWGLPLAIAANLHVPYRLEIGAEHLRDVQIVDDVGKGNSISFHFIFIFFKCRKA